MTTKQQVERILNGLPDDCTLEDVQYHLFVMERIRSRLAQADKGEFIPHGEVEKRLSKWFAE